MFLRGCLALFSFVVACEVRLGDAAHGSPADGSLAADAQRRPDGALITTDGATVDASADAPLGGDRCSTALLCETFEAMPEGNVADGTTLNGLFAELEGSGTLAIDSARVFRGSRSMKTHLNAGNAGGGRFFAREAHPLFASPSQQIYGRFMVWIDSNASSIHWTLFGGRGTIPPPAPAAGARALYMFSVNENDRYMAVYYQESINQDCWHHSSENLPVGRWACMSFEADGEAIRYRLAVDGVPVTSFNVDGMGDGCVNSNQGGPWYGPAFDEFWIGPRSFHPMSGPLDVWIDDLIVDTSPVACE